jgi:predicted RecB family nuclease
MTTKITRDTIESYLNCKYKGLLKLTGESGKQSDYEEMTQAASASSLRQVQAKLIARFGEGEARQGTAVTVATLRQGAPILLDAGLEDEGLALRLDALKRVDGASKIGDHHYIPILHSYADKVGRREKLLLAVIGLALERIQGLRPATGLVARGPEARLGKVSFTSLSSYFWRNITDLSSERRLFLTARIWQNDSSDEPPGFYPVPRIHILPRHYPASAPRDPTPVESRFSPRHAFRGPGALVFPHD